MADTLDDHALDQLFRTARTRDSWAPTAVPELLVRAVYDVARMGPTSANCSPARFFFIHSAEAKERLKPLLAPGNVDKTMAAPWTVIIAYDMKFYERMPELFPHNLDAKNWFTGSEEQIFDNAFRNGTLQGAYVMLAARALGLDCGPMSGFDNAAVDAAFFADDPQTQNWKSNFLCNLGFGDDSPVFPRSPRMEFEVACRVA